MANNNTQIFNELIKRQPNFLDKPLEELLPMRFMGEVAVNAYRGLIKRLDDLPLAQEDRDAKLKDGQDAGKALLMIETRIGELALEEKRIPPKTPFPSGKPPKHERLGMTPKQVEHSQAIASHPQEVEEVIKEAEENEDIPTKTAVLNKIAYKKEKARKKGKMESTQMEMRGNAYLYYMKLEEACALIPSKPPTDLIEKDYITIKALALLIIKKLEVFQNGEKTKSLSRSS